MPQKPAPTDQETTPARARAGRPSRPADYAATAIFLGQEHRAIAERAAGQTKRGAIIKGIRTALDFWAEAHKT